MWNGFTTNYNKYQIIIRKIIFKSGMNLNIAYFV